ncbi:MAG: zinc-binding dehydrogenase [Ktedonobacterales bacterium]
MPSLGVAGAVGAVGEEADPDWVGRLVVADTSRGGGYAERVIVPTDELIRVLSGLGSPDAAAFLHDGRAALGLVDAAQIQPGDWVLVLGAGSGMGILLVQLALAAGARVMGAARSHQKLDVVRELGANLVVKYGELCWLEQVRSATDGVGPTLVFDGVGGTIGRAAFDMTARGGQFSAHGAPSDGFAAIEPQEAEQRGAVVRGLAQVQFAAADAKRLTQRVLSEAAAGQLRPVIGQTFPLERAAEAHAAIEARRAIGKTLLLI